MLKRSSFIFACLVWWLPVAALAQQVEIYEKSGRGTKDNPLPSGQYATFSIRINGMEAELLSGYGYEWRTDPPLGFFGTDTYLASFEIPSLWVSLSSFDVILVLKRGSNVQTITKSFWTQRLQSSPPPGGGEPGTNQPPVISGATASPNPASLGSTINLQASASDPNGDTLTYAWYVNTTGFSVRGDFIGNGRQRFYTVTSTATHLFTVEVSDGKGGTDSFLLPPVQIGAGGGVVEPPQEPTPNTCTNSCTGGLIPPVVDAGPPSMHVKGGNSLQLAGAFDNPNMPDAPPGSVVPGLPASVEWIVEDSAGISGLSFSDPNKVETQFNTQSVTSDTTVRLRLNVSVENCSCFDTMDVTLLVEDPQANTPPVAAATTAKQRYGIGETVVLDASQSSDADGDELEFLWVEHPENPVSDLLSETDSAQVSFVAPEVEEDTSFQFLVQVSDGKTSSSDIVELEIVANSPPNIIHWATSAGPEQTVASGVRVNLSAEAEDPEGEPVTYQWSQLSGTDVEIENADQAEASFVAPAVEEEETLEFRLSVSDGTSSTEQDFAIIVIPAELNYLVFPTSFELGHPLLDKTFIGVAVINPNNIGNDLTISGSDAEGVPTGNTDQRSLSANGQTAFVTTESSANEGALSLLVQGNKGPVQGFFMVGDQNLLRLDGIGGELKESEELYFAVARNNTAETTVFYLYNPSEDSDAELTLSLFSDDGVQVHEVVHTLPLGGTLLQTFDQLFLEEGEPVQLDDGYVVVQSTVPVKGFEFVVSEDNLSSIAAQQVVQAHELLVPHYAIAAGGDTVLRLLNPDTKRIKVDVFAYDDDGALLNEEPGQFILDGKQLASYNLSELLGIDPASLDEFTLHTGYLRLELSPEETGPFPTAARLLGLVTFSLNNGQVRSTLPMLRDGYKETLFLHVAQSDEFNMFTGLAVLNPTSKVAEVFIEAIDIEGNVSGIQSIQLDPGQRLVDLTNGPRIFDLGFSQVGGHIRISSDQPLVNFSLFGDYNQTYLSAIEGQQPLQ